MDADLSRFGVIQETHSKESCRFKSGMREFMLDDKDIEQAEQLARRYGPANCWTGTSGTLAAWIIRLIYDNRELKRQVEALRRDRNNGG